MNQEIKKEWVAALRSGEYKQGRKTMRNKKDEFCCLGVLCEVSRRSGIGRWERGHDAYYFVTVSDIDEYYEYYLPPYSVQNWSDLSHNGKLPKPVDGRNGKLYGNLAALNDEAGYTFEQIADVIEEQL